MALQTFANMKVLGDKEATSNKCKDDGTCAAGAQSEVQVCASFVLKDKSTPVKEEKEDKICESKYMCDKTWDLKDGTLQVICSASKLASAAAAFAIAMAANM